MRFIKAALAAAALAGGLGGALGQTNTYNFTFNVNQGIPDASTAGLQATTNLTGLAGTIANVTVSLDVANGFNGDLYAYLASPSGAAVVLLNRVGMSAATGNSFGYSDTGFNMTFSDAGAYNIHLYQSDSPSYNGNGQLTGTWQPDGRNMDPMSPPSTFDSVLPSTSLSLYNNSSPDGNWTLFLADLSAGGDSTLVNWHLSVMTVPEPATPLVVFGGLGALFLVFRRRR